MSLSLILHNILFIKTSTLQAKIIPRIKAHLATIPNTDFIYAVQPILFDFYKSRCLEMKWEKLGDVVRTIPAPRPSLPEQSAAQNVLPIVRNGLDIRQEERNLPHPSPPLPPPANSPPKPAKPVLQAPGGVPENDLGRGLVSDEPPAINHPTPPPTASKTIQRTSFPSVQMTALVRPPANDKERKRSSRAKSKAPMVEDVHKDALTVDQGGDSTDEGSEGDYEEEVHPDASRTGRRTSRAHDDEDNLGGPSRPPRKLSIITHEPPCIWCVGLKRECWGREGYACSPCSQGKQGCSLRHHRKKEPKKTRKVDITVPTQVELRNAKNREKRAREEREQEDEVWQRMQRGPNIKGQQPELSSKGKVVTFSRMTTAGYRRKTTAMSPAPTDAERSLSPPRKRYKRPGKERLSVSPPTTDEPSGECHAIQFLGLIYNPGQSFQLETRWFSTGSTTDL